MRPLLFTANRANKLLTLAVAIPLLSEEVEEGSGGGWEGEKGWAEEGLPCNLPLECFIWE